jgi:hypothetical protein
VLLNAAAGAASRDHTAGTLSEREGDAMRMPHTPWHWFTVAAVLGLALFTLGEAHGQSTGSNATFEGRPTMPARSPAWAPSRDRRRAASARRPWTTRAAAWCCRSPRAWTSPRRRGAARSRRRPPSNGELAPQRDRDSGVVRKERDSGGVADQGRVTSKAKRATKRTLERKRGVGSTAWGAEDS